MNKTPKQIADEACIYPAVIDAISFAVMCERDECAKLVEAGLGEDKPPDGCHPATWHGGWANFKLRAATAAIRARPQFPGWPACGTEPDPPHIVPDNPQARAVVLGALARCEGESE